LPTDAPLLPNTDLERLRHAMDGWQRAQPLPLRRFCLGGGKGKMVVAATERGGAGEEIIPVADHWLIHVSRSFFKNILYIFSVCLLSFICITKRGAYKM
jgi:hypothetical protein